MDPLTIGLISSGLSAAYKGYQGYQQQKDAKKAMSGLKEPTIEVPAAMRQMAQEPISERVMSAQAQEQARRTAQSVGALQKAGARGIMGGLGGVMDAERSFERNRMANYEQARNEAMGRLGAAEMDVQNRNMQNYLQKMGAAQRGLEAGQQNIAGVLDSVSNVGQQLISAELQGLIPKGTPELNPKAVTVDATAKGMDLETKAPDLDIRVDRTYQEPVKADLPASAGGGGVPQVKQPIPPSTPLPEVDGGVPQVAAPNTRGLKRTPMEAPNMGGIRTEAGEAQQAEDFLDAYERGMGNIPSPVEPVAAPSLRKLRRLRSSAPNMGGLRGVGTPSEYARALQILNRI